MAKQTSQKATKTVTRKQRPRLGPGPPPARREPILHSMSRESACQLPMTQPTLVRSAQKVPGCAVQAIARMACRTPEDTTPTHMASVDKAGRPGCMPTCQANAHPTGPGRGSRSWWNPGANTQLPDRSASDLVRPMPDVQSNRVVGPRASSGPQRSSGPCPPTLASCRRHS